jgi:putative tricarboxylic transport membrane protein
VSKKMKIRIALLGEVLILFAVGAYSIADGIRLVVAQKLKLYDVLGPGWYNIGMGALLFIAGAAYLISRLRGSRAQEQIAELSAENRMQMIYMIVSLFAYAVLIELVGYLAASLVFFAVILQIAGIKSWRNSILIGVIMTIAYYFVFARWLDVIFPRGSLFNIG